MSPQHKLTRGLGLVALARLGAVIDLLTVPLFTWLFGLPAYGVYLVLVAAVTLGSGSLDLAMTTVLQRIVPRAATPTDAARAIKGALLLGVLPGLLLAIAVFAAADPIAARIGAAPAQRDGLVLAVRLFALAWPLTGFIEVAAASVRAAQRFGPEIRLRLVWEQLLRLALALALYPAIGWLALPVAHVAALAVTAVLALRLAGRVHDLAAIAAARPGRRDLARLAGLGLAFVPGNLARRGLADLPPIALNLIVPGTGGATAAALYGIARKLASVPQLVGTVFNYVVAPIASAATGHDEAARLYGQATRLAITVALPVGACLAAASPALLAAFVPQAVAAAPLAAILIAGRTVEAAAGPAAAVVEMLGDRLWPIVAAIAAFNTAAIVALALVPSSGATGMAIAVAAALAVAAVIAVGQLRFGLGIAARSSRTIAAAIAATALPAAALFWLARHAPALVAALALLPLLAVAIAAAIRFGLPPAERAALRRGTGNPRHES